VDHPINHISLCAGYGGIDLGLQRVLLPDCRTVASVEIEAFACANLVSKMEAGQLDPHPIWTDLHTFPFRQFHGLVDILSGGFPCQPFSHAGSRLGVEDKRHLWPRIVQGIGECRPNAVFFENVDGIATAKSPGYESVLHNVLADLEGLGFRATADVFTAQEVGSPHRRKRWFILGLADSLGSRLEGHSRHEHVAQRPERQREGSGPVAESGVPTRWPARPGEQQHEWEPSRTYQPGLGRDADGGSCDVDPDLNRVDRLRLLGNGVVPDVAAQAFTSLYSELMFQR
jgi:DNA (cytosine-5)-methyltransferase 1